jgi:hypothetical protein
MADLEDSASDFSGSEFNEEQADFSGDEFEGQSGSDMDENHFADFSGSEDGDMDGAGSDGEEDSEEEQYKLTKADRAALASGKVGPMRKEKKAEEEDDFSDSEGSELTSDTDYAYSRPNLNHIRNKERNTSLLDRENGPIPRAGLGTNFE